MEDEGGVDFDGKELDADDDDPVTDSAVFRQSSADSGPAGWAPRNFKQEQRGGWAAGGGGGWSAGGGAAWGGAIPAAQNGAGQWGGQQKQRGGFPWR